MNFEQQYAPKSINDVVISDPSVTAKLNRCLQSHTDHKPILFYGPTGTGKTSIARLIPETVDPNFDPNDLFEVQAFNTTRTNNLIHSLTTFCSTMGFSLKADRFVLVDEVDYLPTSMQKNLNVLINQFRATTTFLFTTNDISKVIAPIQSRCLKLNIEHRSMKAWVPRLQHILKDQGIVGVKDDQLENLANAAGGDCREVLQFMEDLVDKIHSQGQPTTRAISLPKVKPKFRVIKSSKNK